ncbi:hypothetical protein ACFL5V_04500 [Fibrobacterota bacterium]
MICQLLKRILLPLLVFAISCLPAGLTLDELRNFHLYIDNCDTLLNPGHKREIERGIKMGMNMWASVLPDLHVIYVDSISEDSGLRIFRIGNYKSDAGISPPHVRFKAPAGCPGHTSWAGCAPRGNTIYFNSRYEPGNRVKHDEAPLRAPWVDFFDNYSRRDWWSKWQPATYPPIYYYGNIPEHIGYIRGRNASTADVPHNRGDFVTQVVHELGHWLGMGHPFYNPDDLLQWYGVPHREGTPRPEKPRTVTVDTEVYKHFNTVEACGDGRKPNPECYYYAGADCPRVVDNACPDPAPPDTVETWVSDFRWSSLSEEYSVMAYAVNGSTHPPGVPHPNTPANMRIIHPRDVNRVRELNPSYAVSYPGIPGVIRMRERKTVYLTSNWLDARFKAELDNDTMSVHPFFVTGIWSKTIVKNALSAGTQHSACIRDDSTLWFWGTNREGELGTGTPETSNRGPVQEFGKNRNWISVAAGGSHTLAIKSDGTLWSWGGNSHGQLGLGDFRNRNIPTRIGSQKDWFSVAGGGKHTIALKTNGTLWTWGAGEACQLGDGRREDSNRPARPDTGNDWIAVSAGAQHSLAMKADGSVWAWGDNHFGQCGINSKTGHIQKMKKVSHNRPFVQVAAGYYHSMALRDDGTVWCWGQGKNGELGNGKTKNSPVPVRVLGVGRIINAVAGARHNMAMTCDGGILAWGGNSHGQLGIEGKENRSAATPVGKKRNWIAVAAGAFHSLAINRNSEAYSWGSNQNGQLGTGQGDKTSRSVPVRCYWN